MQAGEKLALKDTTKGDVIVKLVPLIDNFEAAKNSIKVQSDAEQNIVDSYQVSDLEHELGSMWTGACGQHVDWCMWAACGLVHVPLLRCTIKVLWHLSVLLHAAVVHALQQNVVCIMQNQQKAQPQSKVACLLLGCKTESWSQQLC